MNDMTKTWVAIPLAILLLPACEKARLDEQVRELCAKDGGVKVYETVKLPAERFDKYGQIDFYRPDKGEGALGPEYIFKRDVTYYRSGNPEVSRSHYQVIRRADNKLIGEAISYGRGGGDMPGPWHGSSYSCPAIADAGPNALLRSVFRCNNSNMGGKCG